MKKSRLTILIFIIIANVVLCQNSFGTTNPYQYLKLSNEALSASRYSRVIEISEKFLDENINSANCTSEILVSHLYNIKNAYESIGEPEKYKDYFLKLFEKIDPGREGTLIRSFFILSLDSKGNYFENSRDADNFRLFGDNTEGLEFFDSNVDRLPDDFMNSRPLILAWLPIIRADLLAYNQRFEEAEKEIEKSERIIKEQFSEDQSEILIASIAKEILKAKQGEWDKAISLALKNREQLNKLKEPIKESYALESRLQKYYLQKGEYQKSIEAGKKALVRPAVFDKLSSAIDYRSIQGPFLYNSPSTQFSEIDQNNIYENLALAAFKVHNNEEGVSYADRLLYSLEKEIAAGYSKFAFNKADPALKQKVDLLINVSPTMAIEAPQDSMLQSLAYDAALVYKQLYLSAGNLYRNLIGKLGNPAISSHYANLENSKKLLETISPEKMDSLMERIGQLEATLKRHLDNRINVTLRSLPRWIDVKEALEPQEMAVEFFIAKKDNKDIYVASVINPESKFPKLYELCEVEDINRIPEFLNTEDAYNLLFKPFEQELYRAKTVYFSPAGSLNLLPLEYLSVGKDRLNEKLNIVRLSSTRELAFKNGNFNLDNAILYGGVKYKLNSQELESKNSNSQNSEENNSYIFDAGEESGKNLRAGLAYLPGTLEEIHEIGNLLSSTGHNVTLMEGGEATEASIKSLDRKTMPVVHIATHGFSIQEGSRSKLGRMLSNNQNRSTFEEKSLGLSGLMMAGASNTLEGNIPSDPNDDGILTGREISRIDLSNVNLMVLSACESGLGKVDSEGVMGLQRGFKKAGVQTLIMSLWKVDDTATSILMTEFYKNLINGKKITESLKEAQNYLRNVDGGLYDKPEYWASFIVLDAV